MKRVWRWAAAASCLALGLFAVYPCALTLSVGVVAWTWMLREVPR